MSSLDRHARTSLGAGLRFFLCACVFCLGIHFLVNDLACFNFKTAGRSLPSKVASLRISDNDHQEDTLLGINSALNQASQGLTQPLFDQSISGVSRSIAPLFSPPKA